MSKLFSFIFSIIILAGTIVSLFVSYGVFKALWSRDYFSIIPAFLKKDTVIQAIYPSEPSYMTRSQKNTLISNLIEDYLVYKYTILPDNNLMEQRMGVWWIKKYSGEKKMMDSPYARWTVLSEKSKPWRNFIDPSAGFSPRVMKMVQEGNTRSVEILSPPNKEKDFWNIRLKLYTYSPKTDAVETSYLKIQMAVALKDYLRFSPKFLQNKSLRPALLYNFEVKYIKEILIQ